MTRFHYRKFSAALAATALSLAIGLSPLVADEKPAPRAPASRPAPAVAHRPLAGRGAAPANGRGASPSFGRGAVPANGRGAIPGFGRRAAPANGRGAVPAGRGPFPQSERGVPAGRGPFGTPERGSAARPGINHPLPGGGTAHYGPGGRLNEVRRPGFVARQSPGGRREFIAERPGGRRVVAYGHGGYVEHGFMYRGQRFDHRTYYVNGRPFVRVYRPYIYRGLVVDVYAPSHYYAPGFYAYAYRPWAQPVVYSAWGWNAAPWFSVYGASFAPYPVYAGPSFWLTDYMIAASFQAAYQAQVDVANAAAANTVAMGAAAVDNFAQPLTPDLKQQIAGEVQYQLQQQQMQAQAQGASGQAMPAAAATLPILDSHQHTLQVYTSINVLGVSGGECALTESDILQFNGAQPADGVNASAYVRYSKSQDCPANSIVSVPVDQLQEMSNHMLEVMEQGLDQLQQKQGRDNLPRLSPAMTTTTPASFADAIPPAEPNVEAEVQQTTAEGVQALNGVPGQETTAVPFSVTPEPGIQQPGVSAPGGIPQTAPSSGDISLGQTPEQVKAAWGQPLRQANVGPKLIYFYKDSKVTFQNGVIVDIN